MRCVVRRCLQLHLCVRTASDGEERLDVDLSLLGLRQLTLGGLGSGLQAAHDARVVGHIGHARSDGLGHEELGDGDIEVLTSQTGVSGGGLHLGHAAVEGQQRHIEGSTSEIEDQHLGGLVLVQAIKTVRQSGGGRPVDDAEDVEASDAAGGLGGGALRVAEK